MGVGSLIAVVQGIKARKIIRQSNGEIKGMGKVIWCFIVGGAGLLFWGFVILMVTEFLFSYGTLQLEPVQLATFGRLLTGTRDVLSGFEETLLIIENEAVIAISGKAHHTIAKFTGRTSDTISGTVYEVTPEEIQSADKYEVTPCQRVAAVLQSGTRAWVYVDGRYALPK